MFKTTKEFDEMLRAISSNDMKKVEYLFNLNPANNFMSSNTATSLDYSVCAAYDLLNKAVQHRNTEMINFIIGKIKSSLRSNTEDNFDSNTAYCLLQTAVNFSNFDMIDIILNEGADINYCESDDDVGHLTSAIMNQNEEMVKYLLKKGADVNHKNRPLFIACKMQNITLVNLLIKHGAMVDIALIKKLFEPNSNFKKGKNADKILGLLKLNLVQDSEFPVKPKTFEKIPFFSKWVDSKESAVNLDRPKNNCCVIH